MIAYLGGEVLLSEGNKVILKLNSGMGYQFYYNETVIPGKQLEVFTSQITRENSVELFGFKHFEEKKLFEKLLSVNGVGPKSAFSLLALGANTVVDAILMENQKILKSAQGIGAKAAAKIILDLKDKLDQTGMSSMLSPTQELPQANQILMEALRACEELGFSQKDILPLARQILSQSDIQKPEELLQTILRQVGSLNG